MVRPLFSHHPQLMQNWSKHVTRAVTLETKSTEVQWHQARNQIMKLRDKVHTRYTTNALFLYTQSRHSLRELCMAPETLLNFFFLNRWALVAALLKKWNSLDYNVQHCKDHTLQCRKLRRFLHNGQGALTDFILLLSYFWTWSWQHSWYYLCMDWLTALRIPNYLLKERALQQKPASSLYTCNDLRVNLCCQLPQ